MVKICAKNHTDLTGKRYGRLVVMGSVRNEDGRLMWQCQCDCGNVIEIRSTLLKNGQATNCGCVKRASDKAELTFRKKRYYLGTFRKLENAVKARKEAEIIVEEYLERYHANEEK